MLISFMFNEIVLPEPNKQKGETNGNHSAGDGNYDLFVVWY